MIDNNTMNTMNTQTQKSAFNLIIAEATEKLQKVHDDEIWDLQAKLNDMEMDRDYQLIKKEEVEGQLEEVKEQLIKEHKGRIIAESEVAQLKEQLEQNCYFRLYNNSQLKNKKLRKENKELKQDHKNLQEACCYALCVYCRKWAPTQVINSTDMNFIKHKGKEIWVCEGCCE